LEIKKIITFYSIQVALPVTRTSDSCDRTGALCPDGQLTHHIHQCPNHV